MKTKWDYTNLADAYLKRPAYSEAAIEAMLDVAKVGLNGKICDVGAGAAHLTRLLAARGYGIKAIEPNDAMRANGIKRTSAFPNVKWGEGTGEQTGEDSQFFDLVTFGSSFNVCDRNKALDEVARILKLKGWFACMWNHRNLEDEIQMRIETIIRDKISNYSYGSRREDQTSVIEKSQLFGPVIHLSSKINHLQKVSDCIDAWRSHATLERQAGSSFKAVIDEIEAFLTSLSTETIRVPYFTKIWLAQLR